MNKKAMVAVVISGLAASSFAQRNAIDVQVRLAGESQWLDSLDYIAVPGSGAAHIEVAVFYERERGYGFGGAIHNVVTSNWKAALDQAVLLDRSDSNQHPDGRQGRFNFGSQRQAVYTTGSDAGRLRIAAANNTQNAMAGGINVFQGPPVMFGTLFDTSNPALGFRFDVLLAERPIGTTTEYEMTTPLAASFGWYETPDSGAMAHPDFIPEIHDGAAVRTTWVPGPAGLSVLGAGWLLAIRRGRAGGGKQG